MKVYALTNVGYSLAKQPATEMTAGWKIVYFLRRHGGRATYEQIQNFTGMSPEELAVALRKLTYAKPPIVVGAN